MSDPVLVSFYPVKTNKVVFGRPVDEDKRITQYSVGQPFPEKHSFDDFARLVCTGFVFDALGTKPLDVAHASVQVDENGQWQLWRSEVHTGSEGVRTWPGIALEHFGRVYFVRGIFYNIVRDVLGIPYPPDGFMRQLDDIYQAMHVISGKKYSEINLTIKEVKL